MKSKRIAVLLLVISVLSAAAGCSLLSKKVVFYNESSYWITVLPNMQSWNAFTFGPGEKKEVVPDYGVINFYYDNEDVVEADIRDGGKRITFRDRILS